MFAAETSRVHFSRRAKSCWHYLHHGSESNAPIKGIAITERERLTEGEVKVRVEYVYQDRHEVQSMYLERIDGRWRMSGVDSTQRIKALVAYGTPVQQVCR